MQFAKPCSSNRTRAYADTIKLPRITGRQWGEGKGPISASPYVQPPAVFAFTCPDGGGTKDVCCYHIAEYYRNWISRFYPVYTNGYPDLTSLPKIETNPSVFSLVNLAVNITLPAFAVECSAAAPGYSTAAGLPVLSSDIFCAYGAQQQSRRTPLLRSTDGTD